MKKAFEFDRVFFYKWTVNWKMLSPTVLYCTFKTWTNVVAVYLKIHGDRIAIVSFDVVVSVY